MIARGWGKGDWRMAANEYGVSFQDENVLVLDCGYYCMIFKYNKIINCTL